MLVSKQTFRSSVLTPYSPLLAHTLLVSAAAIAISFIVVLCAAGKYREAAAASLIALAVSYVFVARVSIESLLIFWFATTPLASFYARFPLDKSIITYNRAVIAFAVVLLLWNRWTQSRQAPEISPLNAERSTLNAVAHTGLQQSRLRFSATMFEIAWALLSLIALISAFIQSNDAPYALRIAVDSFWLPLVIFHLARHHFDARNRASALIIAAIALAFFLLASGAFEFATGTNLFAYKGSELIREGERRVNGPFASDSSYAIICLLLFLFLLALPRLFRIRFDRTTRVLYAGALVAVALATLLPLFRTTAIALALCWILLQVAGRWRDAVTQQPGDTAIEAACNNESVNQHTGHSDSVTASPRHRIAALAPWLVGIIIALFVGGAALGYLSFGRRLTDPRNVFGRLATWQAAIGIVIENPLLGVGLANYQEHFYSKYNWEAESVEQVFYTRAANSPHSNWLWIAAELGVIAFVLYAVANVCLFGIGWRALKRASDPHARMAAACYLAIFAAYLISGLTLASGYYSDLNLYFFFLLGLLSNPSLVSQSSPALFNQNSAPRKQN
jgi:O-antigen ligase